MKKLNKTYLDNMVTRLLNETLEEKADKIVSKIKGEVEEIEDDFENFSDEDIDDIMNKKVENDDEEDSEFEPIYESAVCEQCGREMSEGECMECGYMKENYINEGSMCEQCGGEMSEGECMECGYMNESIYHRDENDMPEPMETEEGIYDVAKPFGKKHQSFDYVEEDMNEESEEEAENEEFCKYQLKNFGPDDERFQEKCSHLMESLKGNQRKLDKNKNNKIDAEDFKLLRKSKKHKKETKESWGAIARAAIPMVASYVGSKMGENNEEMEEGNAFTGALAKAKKQGKDEFEVGGKKFQVDEKWDGDVEVEKTGEYENMSIEQINSAIKKLKAKNEKTKESGKKVSQADRTKMSQLYFAKRAKQGWKGKGKSAVKESIELTEKELINLIENIILEQKAGLKTIGKPKGLTKYEQVHKADGRQNDEYLKMVSKKMKEYLKDGSKGDYEMSPKHFPKGNGELAKMNKKAYIPSGAVQDYTDNFTAAALENLDYDGINPDEKRVSDYIEGSSKTGNNPKWANAVETDVNKKRNKIRKDNLLGKLKRKAYNKAPQPVVSDKAGENEGDKIMTKLESIEPKQKIKINEEFEKIKNLISYDRKTQ